MKVSSSARDHDHMLNWTKLWHHICWYDLASTLWKLQNRLHYFCAAKWCIISIGLHKLYNGKERFKTRPINCWNIKCHSLVSADFCYLPEKRHGKRLGYQISYANCHDCTLTRKNVESIRRCLKGSRGRYLLNEPGRQNMCWTGWPFVLH